MMKLMIAYDGSGCADAALDDLKRAGLPDDVEALLVMVSETWLLAVPGGEFVTGGQSGSIGEQEADGRLMLARAADRLRSSFPGWKIETRNPSGSPVVTILDCAEEWKAGMIVVGSHGAGSYFGSRMGRLFIGSVSQRVADAAHCSVRIARGRLEEFENMPVRIVIGIDGSIDSEMAVQVVANRKWPPGTEVRLVTSIGSADHRHGGGSAAVEPEEVDKIHRQSFDILGRAGLVTTTVISFEDPKNGLVHEAEVWGADSIFIGSRGSRAMLNRLGRLLPGSVSTAIATRAHCSVEIVRDELTNSREESTGGGVQR